MRQHCESEPRVTAFHFQIEAKALTDVSRADHPGMVEHGTEASEPVANHAMLIGAVTVFG